MNEVHFCEKEGDVILQQVWTVTQEKEFSIEKKLLGTKLRQVLAEQQQPAEEVR